MTWIIPATGMASRAPRSPNTSTPASTLTSTTNGLRSTVRAMIVTCRTWFSNCW